MSYVYTRNSPNEILVQPTDNLRCFVITELLSANDLHLAAHDYLMEYKLFVEHRSSEKQYTPVWRPLMVYNEPASVYAADTPVFIAFLIRSIKTNIVAKLLECRKTQDSTVRHTLFETYSACLTELRNAYSE